MVDHLYDREGYKDLLVLNHFDDVASSNTANYLDTTLKSDKGEE